MSLFKTIAEIKTVIPIVGSSKFENFLPFIQQAERDFLIPHISQAQFDTLETAYNGGGALSAELTQLLKRCQAALGLYVVYLWIPSGQVSMGDNGIRISVSENLKTAFQWQIDNLQRSIMKSAGSAMDHLLEYMEANKASYADWSGSANYTVFKGCFISTATKFTELFSPLGGSRLNFLAVRSSMLKVQEFEILSLLGAEYYAELQTQWTNNSLTASNKKVFDLVQKAIASLTIARAITDLDVIIDELGIMNFNNTGNSLTVAAKMPAKDSKIMKLELSADRDGKIYLQKIKETLFDNIADYPTYSASSAYDSDGSDHSFSNDSDSKNFNAI